MDSDARREKSTGTLAFSRLPSSPKGETRAETQGESIVRRTVGLLSESLALVLVLHKKDEIMRIRRAEIDWGTGKASLDCRGEGGRSLPAIGLLGSTSSGKTMLMQAVLRLFRSSIYEVGKFSDWKQVSSTVEFDLGSAIATGVIKNGEIVQKLVYPEMSVEESKLSGGVLLYSSHQRSFFACKDGDDRSFGESLVHVVLNDLYKGKVTNSVIWVDDFALGLDDSCARDFLSALIRKSMEGDNQLIVSANREALLQGLGSESIRTLRPSGTNVVETVLKKLK